MTIMPTRLILTLLPFVLPAYVVRFKIGPLPTTLLEVFVISFIILWTAKRGSSGWREAIRLIKKSGWFWPAIAWLLVGLISAFVAQNTVAGLGLWRAYFIEPILVFLMLTDLVRGDQEKNILLKSTAFTLIILALWSAGQYITGFGIPAPWNVPPSGIRATGPFPFPNALALFAVPVSALFAHLAFNRNKQLIGPVLAWPAFLSGLLIALLAKSDGGLIALGVAFAVSFTIKNRKNWHAIVLWLITLAIIFAVPPIRENVMEKILFREWSGKVRLTMWSETYKMLKDAPLAGAGLGNYPNAIKPYHKATWMEVFQYPHNIFLNLWSEIGALGVIVFAWIIALWLKRGRLMALPVVLALLIHGLVDVPYFKNDLAVMFWMLIVITEKDFGQDASESIF